MSSIKLKCLDNSGNNIFLVDSDSGIFGTNTQESLNATTGAFNLSGGISISKSSNATSITTGGALTIAGGASFGKDVHIGGNLTVYGTQTQIVSQIVRIQDNLLVVNSVPNTGRDGGILFQRYQLENDTGLGDVVQDIPFLTSTIVSANSTTITLPASANSTNNFYNGCFIKITSGVGINQVRQITAYNGTTRTATLNTNLTTIPIANDTLSIHNKIYAAYYYSEQSDNFVLGWTTDDPQSSNVTISDYIGLHCGYVSINDTQNALGIGSGGSFTTSGGASINKRLYVGEDARFETNITVANTITTNLTNSQNVNVTNHLTVGNTILTTNLISTYSTCTNVLITNVTSTNNIITNMTASNLISNSLLSTNTTISNLQVTTGITSAAAQITNTNLTNVTISSGVISQLNVFGNSNTIGNIFTTGGNVGINIKTPGYHLDVNGNVHVNANLYVDGIISGGTDTSSTFAYLTLTSTDDAINLSTGSILTYGGITIQSPTDADSVINGGSFLTDGGASISKRLFVGGGIVSLHNSNTVGNIYTTGGNVGIGTNTPGNNLDVSGTARITTSLTTGALFSTNITTTNVVATNISGGVLHLTTGVTTASAKITDANITNMTSESLKCTNSTLTTTTIGTLLATDVVKFTSSATVTSTQNNYSLTSGGLNVTGDVVLSGTKLMFTTTGVNPPSTNGRANGSKIVLYPQQASTTGDYSLGIETNYMWYQVPSKEDGYKWYQGTSVAMSILGNSTVTMQSTENVTGATGGSLVVKGGALIEKDVKINGSLYVDGQNLSSILGNTLIGSFSGTGVKTVTGIVIGKTMNNTDYKILGSLKTTTDNKNVYTVSFKALTTTTFDAVIYRIDSLGSGWSDANLYLSWQITY